MGGQREGWLLGSRDIKQDRELVEGQQGERSTQAAGFLVNFAKYRWVDFLFCHVLHVFAFCSAKADQVQLVAKVVGLHSGISDTS